jgi:hypothetical protein
MATYISKPKSLTLTPVGTGGVTNLGNITQAVFSQSQTEIEIPSSGTYHPIIIPGGRKDTTLTVTCTDLDVYSELINKQIYTSLILTYNSHDCTDTADYKITMSRAILSEIGELSASASGDAVSEYTVTFKGTSDCAGNDNVNGIGV